MGGAHLTVGWSCRPIKRAIPQRSSVERVNAALKDNDGGGHLRIQGSRRELGILYFFGIFALIVNQLLHLRIESPLSYLSELFTWAGSGSACADCRSLPIILIIRAVFMGKNLTCA